MEKTETHLSPEFGRRVLPLTAHSDLDGGTNRSVGVTSRFHSQPSRQPASSPNRGDWWIACLTIANWTGLVFSPTLSASKVGFELPNGRNG